MRKGVFFLFALRSIALFAQPDLDMDYLIPIDHRMFLGGDRNLEFIFSYDDVFIAGARYGKYHVLNAYRDKYCDGVSGPIIYTAADRYVGSDGYIYASSDYSEKIEPLLVLVGGDTFLYIRNTSYRDYRKNVTTAEGDTFLWRGPEIVFQMLEDSSFVKESNAPSGHKEGVFGYWDDGIASIKAWSTLCETINGGKLSYSSDRMRHPFYDWGDSFINFSNGALFWAEGEPGSGIGGTIDIELSRLSDHVMVLNGAVDISRRYLYKANNRLKCILVKSSDPAFSFEYTFEDIVEFQEIKLPLSTKRLTFTILEVYKGEKYDDTCITKIFLKQDPLRPRSEYEAQIQKYVELPKIKKAIEDYEKRKGNR